jgi:hypothetical protein
MMSIARSVPGAEVLRGERGTRDVPQVLIDLAGVDRVQRALVLVLEQPLPGQLVAAPDDPHEPLVVDDDLVHRAALRPKLEQKAARAQEADVTVAQRGQAVAVVVAGVLGVAHAYPRCVEQAHDGREHFFARQSAAREIATHAATELRQGVAEFDHPLELGAVAQTPPVGVIAILLAPPHIPARRLEMA